MEKVNEPKLVIGKPLRKWQHATLTIPVPPGWQQNWEYGRFAPIRDLDVCTDEAGNVTQIVIGLRRSKHNAVKEAI